MRLARQLQMGSVPWSPYFFPSVPILVSARPSPGFGNRGCDSSKTAGKRQRIRSFYGCVRLHSPNPHLKPKVEVENEDAPHLSESSASPIPSSSPDSQTPHSINLKEDEEVQRLLREYGVDPDEVGDENQAQRKRRLADEADQERARTAAAAQAARNNEQKEEADEEGIEKLSDRSRGKRKRAEDFEAWSQWDGVEDRPGVGPQARQGYSDIPKCREPQAEEADRAAVTTPSKATHEHRRPAGRADDHLPGMSGLNTDMRSSSASTTGGSSGYYRSLSDLQHRLMQLKSSVTHHLAQLQSQSLEIKSNFITRTDRARREAIEKSMDVARNLNDQLGLLGGKVNEVTGYTEVERLKKDVTEREGDIANLREIASTAKITYDEAVSTRAQSQRDVNSLLERKHAWDDSDVLRFTSLVRADHSSNAAVQHAKTALVSAEANVEKAFDGLLKSILNRYHEEQVWSDKIRSISTRWTLIVLGVNVLITFLIAVYFEPRRRRLLRANIGNDVNTMLNSMESQLRSEMEELKEGLKAVTTAVATRTLPGPQKQDAQHGTARDLEAEQIAEAAVSEPHGSIGLEAISPISSDQSHAAPGDRHISRGLTVSAAYQELAVSKISPWTPTLGRALANVDPHALDLALMGALGLASGITGTILTIWLRR